MLKYIGVRDTINQTTKTTFTATQVSNIIQDFIEKDPF